MLTSSLVWFRQDLRLRDHQALQAALADKQPLILLYIWDSTTPLPQQWGGASCWWLHQSLSELAASIEARGNRLLIAKGNPTQILANLVSRYQVSHVYWHRCYNMHSIQRDIHIKQQLQQQGCDVQSFNGNLLLEPWQAQTSDNKPYQVFTPYWRNAQQIIADMHFPMSAAPERLPPQPTDCTPLLCVDDLALIPTKPNWAGGLTEAWQPGECGAEQQLTTFLERGLFDYKEKRNFPALVHVSRLSPYLHGGEISPWRVWLRCEEVIANTPQLSILDKVHFQSELGWREFSHHLLYYHPLLKEKNFRSAFDKFPWQYNEAALRSWQQGKTGYPLVDAGMRELWHTGYMHNRVRMVTASFLVKHLLMDWRLGEQWFWDTLVDADHANNSASWQWVAGSGADAAPYFRIFNPILQSEKFDAAGDYIKKWVPELSCLPAPFIHAPWQADAALLAQAGVQLNKDYPLPIVEHGAARQQALAAYRQLNTH